MINRFIVAGDDEGFTAQASEALMTLAQRQGYLRGSVSRAYDDPARWSLVTEWESVGAYRRALSNYDVKVAATPLLARSVDEPSAYETLIVAAPGAEAVAVRSDRAVDPA